MDRLFDNKAVEQEYDRISTIVGPADPYLGKYTVGLHEVLEAHFLLVDFFFKTGEGIGGVGPKDVNLLHSALSRQFIEFGGRPKYSDRIDICATLLFGLVKNHPFFDANKRSGFLVSLLHLQKIGRTPIVKQAEYEDFIVDISSSELAKYPHWGDLELPSPDHEIYVISRYLKKATRPIDLGSKLITYNQLRSIVKKRGMDLQNPSGNRIDLMRFADNEGNPLSSPKRIAHIGFHGWSKQVSIKDIDIVRTASRLDARHGYDSQSFFNGLEDPMTLIRKYKEPLERLAFR
ncbi:MAG: Fic family protein [Devosia sp.]|nr:Fic family protein [Devosia sp.]